MWKIQSIVFQDRLIVSNLRGEKIVYLKRCSLEKFKKSLVKRGDLFLEA